MYRLLGTTINLPSGTNSPLDAPIQHLTHTIMGFFNTLSQLGLGVAVLGAVFSAIFIVVESHKGNMTQMNRGHRLLMGCILAAVVLGGATTILSAAAHAGGSIF
jgi:type II secretory pathway component PulF